jgi:hypothetical protein
MALYACNSDITPNCTLALPPCFNPASTVPASLTATPATLEFAGSCNVAIAAFDGNPLTTKTVPVAADTTAAELPPGENTMLESNPTRVASFVLVDVGNSNSCSEPS